MSIEVALAGVALVGLIAYGVFGGADFGGGVLDLLASGPRKAEQRAAISGAMAPVWEANHVWLIFVIVVLFAGFPASYSGLSTALFVPLHLMLVGITLRGAAFVFRTYGPRELVRPWGAMFGGASVITPVLLGISVGAVSQGGIRVEDGIAVETMWLSPWTVALGGLTLALSAYLAAVFLTNETEGDLREDFRERALLIGGAVVALSALLVPLSASEAPHLFGALLSPRAFPIVAAGATAALASGYALLRGWWRMARASAILQIGLLLSGWGVAQYPYLIYPDVTIRGASAITTTQAFMLSVLPIGSIFLGPSLWLLFRVFKSRARA